MWFKLLKDIYINFLCNAKLYLSNYSAASGLLCVISFERLLFGNTKTANVATGQSESSVSRCHVINKNSTHTHTHTSMHALICYLLGFADKANKTAGISETLGVVRFLQHSWSSPGLKTTEKENFKLP